MDANLERAERQLKEAGQIAARLISQTWDRQKADPTAGGAALLDDLHDLISAQAKALNAIRRAARESS